jgi:hypothetical protein
MTWACRPGSSGAIQGSSFGNGGQVDKQWAVTLSWLLTWLFWEQGCPQGPWQAFQFAKRPPGGGSPHRHRQGSSAAAGRQAGSSGKQAGQMSAGSGQLAGNTSSLQEGSGCRNWLRSGIIATASSSAPMLPGWQRSSATLLASSGAPDGRRVPSRGSQRYQSQRSRPARRERGGNWAAGRLRAQRDPGHARPCRTPLPLDPPAPL